ncbi:MAG: magnesium and cobalt transport protein CorA [Azospira oryzae]|jgi:magnesium transporter|nr:MAG: magnesium and cobalt transport protein CorA [Azospira oryzae]
MIRIFYQQKEGGLIWSKNPKHLMPDNCEKMVWVDMQSPTEEERKWVEKTFQIELYTPQEAAEIESSSRYFEDGSGIEANTSFIAYENKTYATEQVSFFLKKDIFFTSRTADLKSFAETVRKLKIFKNTQVLSGSHILLLLLETQIDLDADFIEFISKLTNGISRQLVKEKYYKEDLLLEITEMQENTILARESIVDKQRLVSSLMKSTAISDTEKDRLRIIFKDINSILQHTEFSFERLEYLQNTFLGLINIEQNKVIKIFTVVTVIFMPPTLIASIYGMNFKFMPETEWKGGYPFAIGLMFVSSLAFLWYFRRKKWL